jgi:hypothetical protein
MSRVLAYASDVAAWTEKSRAMSLGILIPVMLYARTDSYEAFAEAFTAWVGLPSYESERDRLYRIDRKSAAFFDAVTLKM